MHLLLTMLLVQVSDWFGLCMSVCELWVDGTNRGSATQVFGWITGWNTFLPFWLWMQLYDWKVKKLQYFRNPIMAPGWKKQILIGNYPADQLKFLIKWWVHAYVHTYKHLITCAIVICGLFILFCRIILLGSKVVVIFLIFDEFVDN